MPRFRDLPIGRKLVAGGLAASGLALVVSSAVFLGSTWISLRRNVDTQLETQAAIVADNVSAALAFLDPGSAKETLDALRAFDPVDLACLYDGANHVFARYAARPALACPAAPPGDGVVVDGRGGVIVRAAEYRGRRTGTLYLAGNYRQLWAQLAGQGLVALGAVGLGILAAMGLSTRIQRVIADPIRDLSSTAAAISRGGDYSLRARRHGNDEIGQLVETFNTMVAVVERREEQLRTANQLKDEFLAALSHELRTPLNAVLGWTQILRTTATDPSVVERAYASIERNARAQVILIEDLLDISRIVTGKLHFHPELVDLTLVIDAALEVIRPAAVAKEIEIDRDVPSTPQWFTGDPARLQQIAWNLLSNAVKFTDPGGRVRVSLRPDGDKYRFAVCDSGIGITPEFLPHVFDRFRQEDGSLSRRRSGLGLGLAISRELARLHGGDLHAGSDGPGTGATLTLLMPRRSETSLSAQSSVPMDPGGLRGARILIVDDDEEARAVAMTALVSMGCDVETSASAEAALSLLRRHPFDAMLCDLAMPGMDGYELIRRIRLEADPALNRMAAIAVSAHVTTDGESQARVRGFQGFVAKPYTFDAVRLAIRRAQGH